MGLNDFEKHQYMQGIDCSGILHDYLANLNCSNTTKIVSEYDQEILQS